MHGDVRCLHCGGDKPPLVVEEIVSVFGFRLLCVAICDRFAELDLIGLVEGSIVYGEVTCPAKLSAWGRGDVGIGISSEWGF